MPCDHFMEKCALSHLARDRLCSACVTEIWSHHRFRISRLVWTDLQTLWLADFTITASAYWRKVGCKCCYSAKCQCVMFSDHISVNKLCDPHFNATSDFCSTKKNTPLLSFKLKYSVFQFEHILMGFDTANGFWDRRARLCNVHFQGHSVVRQRHRRLGRVRWPVPPSRVLAPHMCVAGPVGEMCDVYIGSGCFSASQKKSLFSFKSFSETSNCLEFYAVLIFQLAKGGGGVWKCDELITINLSVTIVTL